MASFPPAKGGAETEGGAGAAATAPAPPAPAAPDPPINHGMESSGRKRRTVGECRAVRDLAAQQFPGWDPAQHTAITRVSQQRFRGGPLYKEGFRLSLLEDTRGMEQAEQMLKAKAALSLALQRMVEEHGDDAVGQVVVHHPNLHTTHLASKFGPLSSFAAMDLVNKFAEAKNSEDAKKGDDEPDESGMRLEDAEFFVFRVEQRDQAFGTKIKSQFSKRQKIDIAQFLVDKKSVLEPLGAHQRANLGAQSQHWCLVLSCVLGQHRVDFPTTTV